MKIAPDSPEVALALMAASEDKGQRARDQLVYPMTDLKIEKARLERLLLEGTKEVEPHIRNTCAWGLDKIRAQSPAALATIAPWKKTRLPARATASDKESVARLIESIRNPQDRFDSWEALERLREIGPAAAEAVPALIEVTVGSSSFEG